MNGPVTMTGRERLLTSLDHREPDRVPYDLGSTQVTGIHSVAYTALRECLGLPPVQPVICDDVQGLALPDDDLVNRLGVDVRGLFPLNSHNDDVAARVRRERPAGSDEGDEVEAFVDEWGITQHRPYPHGLYFTAVGHPLAGSITVADVEAYRWPDTGNPRRIVGLREQALGYRAEGRAVMVKGVLAGIFEMAQRVRGMAALMMDMASDEALAEALLDKMLALKLDFWEMALPQLRDVVDVVSEADDYGTQVSQLISPRMFRRLMKPRLAVLFKRIHELAPEARLFFHSCGNVRPLLPDFVEIGVDILNPVHVRATGMNPVELKRDFGKDMTFWGGGVDTQDVLPHGTPQEVADDVRRNVEALAPGGGFVFNTVHNIQADVPAGKRRRNVAGPARIRDLRMSGADFLPFEVVFNPRWWHNTAGIDFTRDFYFDAAVRERNDLLMRRVLHERFGEAGLGEADPQPRPVAGSLHVAGGFVIPALLGAEVQFEPDAAPQPLPCHLSVEQLERLAVPDWRNRWPMNELIASWDGQEAQYGRLVGDLNTDGLLNAAYHFYGQDLFADFYAAPERVGRVLDVISQLIAEIALYVRSRTGSCSIAVNRMVERVDPALFLHANCSVQMISPKSYRTMQLPVEKRLAAALRPFGVHHCGANMHQVAPAYRELELVFADVGWGSDVAACRAALPDTFLNLRLSPIRMLQCTPDEVAADAENLLRAAGRLDGAGICCINMDYGTPDENLFAVYEVVERYRRYGG